MYDYILEITDFSISIHDQLILSAIELKVETHGLTVMVGSSGIGKSVLLQTLAGLNEQKSRFQHTGHVQFMGKDLFLWENYPALVKQDAIQMMYSVQECLFINLSKLKRNSFEQFELLQDICVHLKQEWILQALNRRILYLPLYQQRKLAIICKYLTAPDLMMLDEPTINLNEKDSEDVYVLIQHIAEEIPILMTSSHADRRDEIANVVVVLG